MTRRTIERTWHRKTNIGGAHCWTSQQCHPGAVFSTCVAVLAYCALVASAADAPSKNTAAAARPNILWISCEDISADLGCYGDRYAVTPNLDRFAREGVRYTHVFGIAGVCAVNRSGIITAMYPTTIGTQHMRCRGVPAPYIRCFTEYLRAAGYYCTNNVKTDYNFNPPLTAWDESSRTAHWRNRAEGQPFFAVFNLTTTHESQIRTDEATFARRTAALLPNERHDPTEAVLPPYYPDTPIVRRDWARYYDLITAMDKQVAAALAELEEEGLADETIVFYWSDHGRGLPRAKRWLYDSGLHVPMIVRWPGKLKAGTVSDELISFIDFGPTVMSLAGVDVPDYMQGRPFLGDQKAPPRDYIFAARDRMDETYDLIRAVRDKRYKYLRNYEPYKTYAQDLEYMNEMPTMKEMRRLNAEGKLTGPQRIFFQPTKPIEELYDTQADPHEVRNLADSPEHREVLERMRDVHERWRLETRDLGLIPESELWAEMRPDDQWETTEPPSFEPAGGSHTRPVTVTLRCPTEGGRIAYTTGSGDRPHWKLYHEPIVLERSVTLRAKAVRLGFRESEETRAVFEIVGGE